MAPGRLLHHNYANHYEVWSVDAKVITDKYYQASCEALAYRNMEVTRVNVFRLSWPW